MEEITERAGNDLDHRKDKGDPMPLPTFLRTEYCLDRYVIVTRPTRLDVRSNEPIDGLPVAYKTEHRWDAATLQSRIKHLPAEQTADERYYLDLLESLTAIDRE